MFKAWTGSAGDAETLARSLEAHLNEFAAQVVSIGYAVAGGHHALVVYRSIDMSESEPTQTAVEVAESILDDARPQG